MGFYLPGIGEAIGGGLRMQRQNELWTKAQEILKDESKPYYERIQLVGVAYPELVNTEQYKQQAEQARLADNDKMARAKFDREEAAAASAQRFRDKIATIPEEQRRGFILANPDVAAEALPELLKQYQGEVKAEQEDATWNERFQLQEGGKNARNAATNAATVKAQQLALDKEYRAGVASGAVDPATGQIIPYAQKQADAQAMAVETAGLKDAQKAEAKKAAEVGRLDAVTARQVELFDDLTAMREEGAARGPEKTAQMLSKQSEIVDLEARRRTPVGTEPNSTLVEQIYKEYGFDQDPSAVGVDRPAALGGTAGFKAARTAINERRQLMGLPPITKKGAFSPAPDSIKPRAQ